MYIYAVQHKWHGRHCNAGDCHLDRCDQVH